MGVTYATGNWLMKNNRSRIIVEVAFCLCLLIALSGCIKNTIRIKIEPAGSGTIVVTRFCAKGLVTYYADHIKPRLLLALEEGEEPPDPFFNEDTMKKDAESFGKGVSFVSSRRVDKAGGRGFIALYSFADINHVSIPVESIIPYPNAVLDIEELQAAENDAMAFTFELQHGAEKELKVMPPAIKVAQARKEFDEIKWLEIDEELKEAFLIDLPPGAEDDGPARPHPFGLSGKESGLEAAMAIMGSANLSLAVEVTGTVSDSKGLTQHRTRRNCFILATAAIAEILADDQRAKVALIDLSEKEPESAAEFFSAMSGHNGISIQQKDAVIKYK